ncbi:MAG: hypothetical protein HYI21_10760 [Sediminibacterium sp. Gen4]|jgi:hypothetical protein|uniref:hypothetical protein n=1 Tax=Sediminibacterium sp. Gen4 TaxID=2736285 RepID=UPI0015B9E97B|nr:hypothetical protein [Sediminibacterium sp. Gen4]MBW0162201.1 DUF3127 domain-containing protein [Sediminibacterium sp.]NWK66499.1 hypothetical protein [Sediminibacterium sp. Gen4]
MATLSFPNGFESWHESHFKFVEIIIRSLDTEGSYPHHIHSTKGTGGLYELTHDLTNQFEQLNTGREWNGEFFDEVEAFANNFFQQQPV